VKMMLLLLILQISLYIVCSNTACPADINVDNILDHLYQLDQIARVNNGNRAAGTSGYDASAGYIISQLSRTNLRVTIQPFTFSSFEIIGTPTFSQNFPNQRNFVYQTDFRLLSGSGSGDITGSLVYNVPNLGCNVSDYNNFPAGRIAVIGRGICSFTEKANLADNAGAIGVIIYNNNGGGVFSGSVDAEIPAIAVSNSLGLDLTNTVLLSYDIETLKGTSVTQNVLAETISGDPNSIIVVGSHLDGVPAGPGINDNGSGSSLNLELALTLSQCAASDLKHKLRFAWWGAEELGLLGSYHYVEDLRDNNPVELAKIALNLNFDMVGSPNYFYGIYNGSGAAPNIRERSVFIQRQFEIVIGSTNSYQLTSFDGRSDYGPFIENNIPAGGLFSGAEGIKNAASRTLFKGLANTAYDPCYHDYCDSYENISEESLKTLSDAAYKVTHFLVTSLMTPYTYTPDAAKHIMEMHPNAISRY